MWREKSIEEAGLALKEGREVGGSDLLDYRMMGNINQKIDDARSGARRKILPPLPQGYSWIEPAGGLNAQSIPRIRTPDGDEISFDEIDAHVFKTDRSARGRNARIWERTKEGFRDATFRREWGLSSENEENLRNSLGGGLLSQPISELANIAIYGADLINIPSQMGAAFIGQYATEVQDKLGLPFWKYGTSRPDDLWEAGGSAYEDWADVLPVMSIPLGGISPRLSPRSLLTKYERDVEEALNAGYPLAEADYLAQPYTGAWHHSPLITASDIRQAVKDGDYWVKELGESKWNKKQPEGWSRLDFYKFHGRNDQHMYTANLKNGMQWFDKRRFGIEHYGPIRRAWNSTPTRTKLLLGSPFLGAGGAVLGDELMSDPKIPPERN